MTDGCCIVIFIIIAVYLFIKVGYFTYGQDEQGSLNTFSGSKQGVKYRMLKLQKLQVVKVI